MDIKKKIQDFTFRISFNFVFWKLFQLVML